MAELVPSELVNRFEGLHGNEKRAIVERKAKTVLGGSVIWVFREGTKKDLVRALKRLRIDRLRKCRSQQEFYRFFTKALGVVDQAILLKNRGNKTIGTGHKWGHAAKVTCLYIRGIVLHTRYFNDATAKRLRPFLFVPVDKIVLRELRRCGVKLESKAKAIKQIDSKKKFFEIQDLLAKAARQAERRKGTDVPRILFDDVWSEN